MNKQQANEITGGLSRPGKMPEGSISLPARACNMGSKLRKVPGSVCAACYAHEGRYSMHYVQNALERRLVALGSASWVVAMVVLVKGKRSFRWHDSGDVQDLEHFDKICAVAAATPETNHWLPTKERAMLSRYSGAVPDNLLVRHSVTMINALPPRGASLHLRWSAVWTREAIESQQTGGAVVCPASEQGNRCADCRACWNPEVLLVIYPEH